MTMTARRRIAPLLGAALAAAALAAAAEAAPAPSVEVRFVAGTAADEWDARTYRAIWNEYGERIVRAFETVTCLPFSESIVPAVVMEDVSNSGGPEHPMQLRASYARSVKQATLVHELGHRLLWQLGRRLDGIDGHMTLDLVLERVWAEIWGQDFARRSVAVESAWRASYDYGAAWEWARSLTPATRARLWNELLTINGFRPGACGPVDARPSSAAGGTLAR